MSSYYELYHYYLINPIDKSIVLYLKNVKNKTRWHQFHSSAIFILIFKSLCVQKIYIVQHFTRTHMNLE